MKYPTIAVLLGAGVLGGCAGSANHEVISPYRAGDETLTCAQLDAEITRTQVIIDGVSQDKSDLSGADVIDGLLFFPFNLIAKSGNYKAAVEAAGKRIGRLQKIKKEQSCRVARAAQPAGSVPGDVATTKARAVEAEERVLGAEEITAFFPGKRVEGVYRDKAYTQRWLADGSSEYKTRFDTRWGAWYAKQDKYCSKWGPRVKCYTVMVNGRDVYWIRSDGTRHRATLID